MIVLDTSAALAALLGQPAARSALIDQRLAAPQVIDAEIARAVRGLTLGKRLSDEQGALLLQRWSTLVVDRLPMPGLLDRVWQLRHNLSAYDAMFVAAAETLDITLVTADRRLATATGPRCRIQLIPRTS